MRVNIEGGPAGPAGPDARRWLDLAVIDDRVAELRPDYTALVIVADGLRPGPSDQATDALLSDAEAAARAVLAGRDPSELGPVAAWRVAYQAFGAKPKRTRPSVEALLRRVEAGLPRIDRLTDIYNAMSVKHLVPIGGEDLAQYRGPARLVRAAGDEPFDTNRDGQPVTEYPAPGEVVWRDDAGVTCRCWNWRQCVRTRITDSTVSAMFILDGLAALGTDGLQTAGLDLAGHLTALHPQVRLSWRQLGAAPLPTSSLSANPLPASSLPASSLPASSLPASSLPASSLPANPPPARGVPTGSGRPAPADGW
jgi:DNA/RNA-binding domain of Phe-tRNA-synthetase-like protein